MLEEALTGFNWKESIKSQPFNFEHGSRSLDVFQLHERAYWN
jgi:hypothetical protein